MSKTYISKYMSNITYLQWHDILGNLICMVLFSGIYLPLNNEPSIKVHFYFHRNLIFKILRNILQHINIQMSVQWDLCQRQLAANDSALRKHLCTTYSYITLWQTFYFLLCANMDFFTSVFANNDISRFVWKVEKFWSK